VHRRISDHDAGIRKWHSITIPCTKQNAILIPAKTTKIFFIKKKDPEVKTRLVPLLYFGDERKYAENALA